MNEKPYIPAPLNTEDIELSEDLTLLIEEMARNVHEVWSIGRIKNGWRYGKTRNDSLKTHPCLISYEDLSESEREYDRQTATQTLKLIIKLGFEINKK